jgi:anhydro-N-acetylmuramic acid kinase
MKVLGLISGTSHDGVDAALVDFTTEGDLLVGRLLHSSTTPYPDALRSRLAAALPPAATDLAEMCALDNLIGQHFRDVALAVLGDLTDGGSGDGASADLVCSHGQTVYHWVEGGHCLGTLQLGQPAWIAQRTGLPVLSDVRAADIAAGGHGAPLVCVLDALLLGGSSRPVAALNLGGIANITVLQPGRDPYAFDIGPANALVDAAVLRLTAGAESFDPDGRYAASGKVEPALLDALLADPYYALAAPKSTGKEHFHAAYLDAMLDRHPGTGPVDVVATVTELTARVVADAVAAAGVREVVASGGGVANSTLWQRIRDTSPDVTWRTTDDLGAPAETKEAIAFALVGWLSAHGLPGNVASCTGASGGVVLGRLSPGHRGWPTMGPPERMPSRLELR